MERKEQQVEEKGEDRVGEEKGGRGGVERRDRGGRKGEDQGEGEGAKEDGEAPVAMMGGGGGGKKEEEGKRKRIREAVLALPVTVPNLSPLLWRLSKFLVAFPVVFIGGGDSPSL